MKILLKILGFICISIGTFIFLFIAFFLNESRFTSVISFQIFALLAQIIPIGMGIFTGYMLIFYRRKSTLPEKKVFTSEIKIEKYRKSESSLIPSDIRDIKLSNENEDNREKQFQFNTLADNFGYQGDYIMQQKLYDLHTSKGHKVPDKREIEEVINNEISSRKWDLDREISSIEYLSYPTLYDQMRLEELKQKRRNLGL